MTHINKGWKACKIHALDRLYEYQIGEDNCVGIFNEYECPEPHCGIEFIRVHFENGRVISYNKNYIPSIELTPVEQPSDETKKET